MILKNQYVGKFSEWVAIGSEKAKQEKLPVTGRSLKQTEKPRIKVKATLDKLIYLSHVWHLWESCGCLEKR